MAKPKKTKLNRNQRNAFDESRLSMRASVRPSTTDEQNRTVEVVVATQQPVLVQDPSTRAMIDEVLVADGGVFPDSVPFNDEHKMRTVGAVLGSVTQFRRDGEQWIGVVAFSDDAEGHRTFGLYRDGHLTDVSVGYRYLDYVDIPRGKSRRVAGRMYTARARMMRIVTKWQAVHVAATQEGADSLAKARHTTTSQENSEMNKRLRAYLESLGLGTDATDDQAREFMTGLRGSNRTISNLLDYDENDSAAQTTADLMIRSAGFDPANPAEMLPTPDGGNGGGDEGDNGGKTGGGQVAAGETGQRSSPVHDADYEFNRQQQIRSAAGRHVPENIVQQAIDDRVTVDQARARFLEHVTNRPEPVGNEAPAGHSRNSNAFGLRKLQAIMMMRAGHDPVEQHVEIDQESLLLRSRARVQRDELERAAEEAERWRAMSYVDVLRHALALDNFRGAHSLPQGELFQALNMRAAPSLASVQNVFTQHFAVQLISGYEGIEDTTGPFTTEGQNPNYQRAERIRLQKGSGIRKHNRGGTAEDIDFDDNVEYTRVHKYSGKFVVDEMDIVDDRFGAIDQHAPSEMGEEAGEIRPNLVYYLLLSNPNMADGNAFFNVAAGNLRAGTGLTPDNIRSGLTQLMTQTENGRLLSNGGTTVLLTSEDQMWNADQYVNSGVIRQDGGVGDRNTLLNKNIQLIADARIDVGVKDPLSETVVAGAPLSWWLIKTRQRPIEVTYLAGAPRSPQVRSGMSAPGSGQWCLNWDVAMRCGASAIRRLTAQRNDG